MMLANISSNLASIERIFLQLLLIILFCRIEKTSRQSFFMKIVVLNLYVRETLVIILRKFREMKIKKREK